MGTIRKTIRKCIYKSRLTSIIDSECRTIRKEPTCYDEKRRAAREAVDTVYTDDLKFNSEELVERLQDIKTMDDYEIVIAEPLLLGFAIGVVEERLHNMLGDRISYLVAFSLAVFACLVVGILWYRSSLNSSDYVYLDISEYESKKIRDILEDRLNKSCAEDMQQRAKVD